MILYLDASALVKRYIAEQGSELVGHAIATAAVTGTSVICRAEIAAALAKGVRMNALTAEDAGAALQVFRGEWQRLVRVQATEALIGQADLLAWESGLRGYDAVHLASALLWRDAMGEDVTFAAFDRRLWVAAGQRGLLQYPADLPALLDAWQQPAAQLTKERKQTEDAESDRPT
jgi:predicted nucleic acid-binding protein